MSAAVAEIARGVYLCRDQLDGILAAPMRLQTRVEVEGEAGVEGIVDEIEEIEDWNLVAGVCVEAEMMDYSEAVAFFDPDEAYLLSTHLNADGDGMGALLALGEMLHAMGRDYRIVLGDEVPSQKFAFLSGFDRIESYGSLGGQPPFTRAVFVDTPTFDAQRVGIVAQLLGKDARVLIIDHHAGKTEEGDVRLVDSGASAASELVYRLIQAAGVDVSQEMAMQIYAGIVFDTKLFKFSHPKRALKVCAELVDLGADPEGIADALFARQSYETVKTLGVALSSLALHMEGRVSTLVVNHTTYLLGGDLDLVVDYAMAVEGVEVALFFKEEEPGHYRVSLRSRGAIDVNQVAQIFGGGGHERASGCQLDMLLSDAKQALLEEVERRMKGESGTSGEANP